MFTSKFLVFSAVTLFLKVSFADNNTSLCGSSHEFENGFNASGKFSSPGFRVNDTYPASTWDWSRFVVDQYISDGGEKALVQTLGLQTSPMQNLSDPNLPYTGCILIPSDIAPPPSLAIEKDDDSCNAVLSASCVQELKTAMSKKASSISGSSAGGSDFSCPDLINTVLTNRTSTCTGISATTSTRFPISSQLNQGSSTAKDNAFPTWSTCVKASREDYTMYDNTVRSPQPVFVAAWLKATSNDTSVTTGGWSDSMVFCIPTKETEPGSRTLADADKAAGVSAPSAAPSKHSGAVGNSEAFLKFWWAGAAIVMVFNAAI